MSLEELSIIVLIMLGSRTFESLGVPRAWPQGFQLQGNIPFLEPHRGFHPTGSSCRAMYHF